MTYINPEWFFVDGKWRHLVKIESDDAIYFYAYGVLQKRVEHEQNKKEK